ncbi:pilus assembly protein [Pseudorhodoferax sp.]|uniref:pilus assembly protein n=1 Tax=Pseudorhodoferax sp. TaxID=1993553 RepID=UPI002DD698F4|nr:PilC/PilY family type IV pilus protein [Pseudorhodoferax sp.]
MRQHPRAKSTLLSVLIAAIGMPPVARAEQLPLMQYPAGAASRQPAPNVILTLDDSGSMGSATSAGAGMYELKRALQDVFSASAQNIPDGSIRLAWNAMNKCRAFPADSVTHPNGCGSNNLMRVLDATHRANFLKWVGQPGATAGGNGSTLTSTAATGGTNGTPTHRAYVTAGDYLMKADPKDPNGPWAHIPGTTLEPVLSCRRSYIVLMTDGGWNWTFAQYGGNVARGGKTTSDGVDGNPSNMTFTLPDQTTQYVHDSAFSRVYRDTFTNRLLNGLSYEYVPSLANLAFYYWATDIAPTLKNDVPKLIKQSGPQTFGTGTSAVTLPEFWNPKNDPATWQHITTYTIGFSDASKWETNSTNPSNYYYKFPKWDTTGANDTFGGDFDKLVTGTDQKAWPDPVRGTTVLNSSTSTGSNNEQARQTELWHMALNGRGRFVPATANSADLVKAFKEIFGAIISDSKVPVTGYAASASYISTKAATQYTTGYEAEDWNGYVRAETLAQNPSTFAITLSPDANWSPALPPILTTADKLDALNAAAITSRLILTWSDQTANPGPTSFQWTQDPAPAPALRPLSAAQKDLLKESTASTDEVVTLGQRRLNFIRGDLSQDGQALRKRKSRQGDIVNSVVWYVADPVSNYSFDKYGAFALKHKDRLPMVYVGGNDGMLHGFSGFDGTEMIAYVPKGVIQTLPELTRSNYQHRYYVDGSPFSGDVYVKLSPSADPEWRTFLIGTLGAGGKGYFVLDVTTPGSKSTAKNPVASNFAKANADALVIMDKTSPAGSVTEDADIGHIMVAPVLEDNNPQKTTQIVRMNDGRWAVVMGNGYNSTNERPVLLIQYLDGAKELLKIVASSGTGATNGLSAPRLVDINGDGTPDVIYAGDLLGNLWKFNVSSASSSEWNVAFSGAPLYRALHTKGSVSTPQPITAPPIVRANERGVGGLMVAFGTGRNLTEGDRTSTGVQSIYSVLDSTRYKLSSAKKVTVDDSTTVAQPVGSGVTELVEQDVNEGSPIAGNGTSVGRTFYTVTQNAVSYAGVGAKKGWYLNLPDAGERVLAQMSFFDSSNIIELISEVPASGGTTVGEACSPPPATVKKYRTLLNIMDGKAPSVQVMNTNGDTAYDALDGGTSRMTASAAENHATTKGEEIRVGSDGGIDKLRRLPEIPLRPTWRQLQ